MHIPRLHRTLWASICTFALVTLILRPLAAEQSTVLLPVVFGPAPPRLLIAAAHIDSTRSGEPDEAILIWNLSNFPVPLAGWQIVGGSRRASVPITSTITLAPESGLWCAAQSVAFRTSFGERPGCEWGGDSDPVTPDVDGKPTLTNSGGVIQLLDPANHVMDTLLYGNEDRPAQGWRGPAAQAYTRGDIAAVGQVWQRKVDPVTGQWQDSNRASDWSGDLTDLAWGRRAAFPGWRGWTGDALALPATGAAHATITVAIGPEGLYAPLAGLLTSAQHSIDLSIYTLEHVEFTQILTAAAKRGVAVRILLEGSPPGGISPFQKWCVAQIVAAGGDVRYSAMAEGAPNGLRTRYRYSHAKYGIIDSVWAINGTENFGVDSMPVPGSAPAGGRRGFYLITDAAPVVTALTRIFATDWAPDRFLDLHPFDAAHPRYGAPPADFVLPETSLYPVTAAPFAVPFSVQGTARFMVVSAPENAMRPDSGLMALIGRAGAGDEIVDVQLYEQKHWGSTLSNPVADPNPRLQALIDAARRGARVRLLLDSFFDEPDGLRSNRTTVDYIASVAAAEGIDIEARLGNPTLGGIHAKLFLLRLQGDRWSAVGSLNGGEVSHKLNREVVVLTDAPLVYARLMAVFDHDWAISP